LAEINGIQVPFIPAGGIKELNKESKFDLSLGNKSDFNEIFNQELNKIKFSSHAQSRISSRDIELSDNDISRLESAVDKVRQKGSKESLVMLDAKAFIINIPNNTVITVVDKDQLENKIITEIDSAIFA
jgi:flagellar operon protein